MAVQRYTFMVDVDTGGVEHVRTQVGATGGGRASTDAERAWVRRMVVGSAPQALVIADVDTATGRLVAAYQSIDGGQSWWQLMLA